MSTWTKYFIFSFMLFFSVESFAQTPQPPQFLNVQAVLLDEGGNVLRNRQEADIEFSIIDGAGNIFYEETQHVFLMDGAISVLVGSGVDIDSREAKAGIPFEALDPTSTRLLRIKLADQSIPQEELELVSVPYSFYSKFAVELTKPITTASIADGTIALADFSQELISYIDNSISGISKQDLDNHKIEAGAHPASSITVRTSLANSAQANLQSVLDDIDAVLSIYSNQDNELVEDITTNVNNIATNTTNIATNTADIAANSAALAKEATDRAAGDAANAANIAKEATDRANGDTNLTNTINGLASIYVEKDGDTMTGDLSLGDKNITNVININTTNFDDLVARVDSIDTATPDESGLSLDSRYINAGAAGTEDGKTETMTVDLIMSSSNIDLQGGNIKMADTRTVDDVDVSALDLRVQTLEVQIEPIIPQGANVEEIPQAIRPLAYGRCLRRPDNPAINDELDANAYNVSASDSGVIQATNNKLDCHNEIQYNFLSKPNHDNYFVFITAFNTVGTDVSTQCRATDQTVNSFRIFCTELAGYNFLVFHNP